MSRYRKTMRQAIEEGLSNMQIAILSKEYKPLKGKTITAARAKQLMNILDKFKDDDLKKLSKANIPFVSSGSQSKLTVRNMGVKVTTFSPFGSFREEVTQQDFDLEEGKMKTIATMFDQGKSAEEIAKVMKLPVDTVKNILGEVKEDVQEAKFRMEGEVDYKNKPDPEDFEMVVNASNRNDAMKQAEINLSRGGKKINALEFSKVVKEELIHEFKKMTVSFKTHDMMAKASTDLAKQGFTISGTQKALKVDGKGADLNKYATDLKNNYGATIRAESYAIDESADEDFYNPVYEACWVGYKKVGMKKKGDKMVPNCVPESVNEEDEKKKMKKTDVAPDGEAEHAEKKEKTDDKEKLKSEIDKKDAEIQSLKVKAETDKAKVAKKETEKMVNPETGEPLLQVGVAYKHLRDKMKKMKEDVDYLKPKMNTSQLANIKKVWQHKTKKDVTPAVKKMIKDMDIPTQLAIKYAKINQLSKLVEDLDSKDKPTVKDVIGQLKGAVKAHAKQAKDLDKAMKNEDHPAKKIFEQIEGLKNKAEKSGMPYGILKKVYDRGMAAWRGGHRPGTTQQQWAFARVNSFITKSSGTWGGADKDLAAKVKGSN